MPASAEDLPVAGLQPLSSVDWPGRLAAVLFTQGCPWKCLYCHNHDIIDPRKPGAIPWQDVREFLHRRRRLLEGVVFSGGEPTRTPALVPAAREVADLGFDLGMHTAGAYPRRLAEVLDQRLFHWVGLDVKATRARYGEVAGRANAGDKAWESLSVVLSHAAENPSFTYEVRLTVFPALADDALAVAERCREAGVRSFALQKARGLGAPTTFNAGGARWAQAFDDLADQVRALDFPTVEIRV